LDGAFRKTDTWLEKNTTTFYAVEERTLDSYDTDRTGTRGGLLQTNTLHCVSSKGVCLLVGLFDLRRDSPQWARASSFTRFLDHTRQRTTVGRTPLDERSARRRDLYLTTHNTHNRQISMPSVRFEPTVSAGERPQI